MSGAGGPGVSVFDHPAAGWLYDGLVTHARMTPFGHRFAYRVWCLLLDIDRIGAAAAGTRLLRHNRFGLVSAMDRDFGPDDGTPPRAHLDRLLAAAGVAPPARAFLMFYPRVLGFTFNPIAVWYGFDAAGALSVMVYEVRNTFGEKHIYVAPVAAGEASAAGLRQERDKLFFVSPFLGFGLTYRFRLNVPGDKLVLRIMEVDAATRAPVLAATFSGVAKPLDDANLARACVSVPFLGLKVVAGIHWEALKLWLKGAKLVPRPKRPPPASVGTPPRYLDPASRS
jgi:hypothetical protein